MYFVLHYRSKLARYVPSPLSLSLRFSRRKFGITSENASVPGSAHSEYNITPAARGKLFSYSNEPTSDFSCVTKERAAPEAVCAREARGRSPCGASFEVVPGPIPTVSFGLAPV